MNFSSAAGPARRLAATALLVAATLVPGLAAAHNWEFTEAIVGFTDDGRYRIDFYYDLDAMVAGSPPGHLQPEIYEYIAERATPEEFAERTEQVKRTLLRTLRVTVAGETVEPLLELPELGQEVAGYLPPGGPWPGTLARLTGPLPSDPGTTMTFRASRLYGPVAMSFAADPDWGVRPVPPGHESEPFLAMVPPPPRSGGEVFVDYLVLGFEHILPKGLDHILFVLGLFLLAPAIRPLLWQVSAFTLAHTATLALSIYGIVELPSRLVETLIALSIAYVGVENVFTEKLHPWRPALVFGFGLLHGMGFAGVLGELGLPEGQFAPALVAFNVGVEIGQLTVVALAALAVGWFRGKPWYRKRIAIPASIAISLVALWWTIERGFALGG